MLLSLPSKALKFGFMFSYDVTKIIEGMPPEDRFYLMRPKLREKKKCDFAKRAIVYGASLGVQKYMQAISEKQELLGVLADSLILTFGMDSAISRTLQLIAAKGEAASQIPIYMTQLFVAKAHEQVFDMLREMMMWMSQDEEWGREIRDINNYYNLDRINTFSLRRKVAKHVIEAGGYAL